MSQQSVFDLARGRCSPELVEALFNSPGAYWDGDEFWTLNPTRGDSSVGSFSVNGRTGMWSDFASSDKGDLIALMVAAGRALSKKEAAEMIVKALDGVLPEAVSTLPAPSRLDKPKKAKVKPVIPVPAEKLKELTPVVKSAWTKEHHGEFTEGYAYRDAEGRPVFCVSRFRKPDGSKDVVPHYFGEDGRWHEGQALESGRPLYGLHILAKAPKEIPVLVVEGEKCAKVEVPGYIVVTWSGGALATAKTDWSPLDGRRVVVWPDADEAGFKAAAAIKNRLEHVEILDIKGKPKGWDIADAESTGAELVAFIAACPIIGGKQGPITRPDDAFPFRCLGYDKAAYYFLPRSTRVVYAIGMGSFRNSQMLELAPLSWWGTNAMVTDAGAIKQAPAQELLIDTQHKIGFFDPKTIRGAGVWRDAGGVVLNDGRQIVTMDRQHVRFDEYRSTFVYVPSQVGFGEMHGDQSSDADGARLQALFLAQEFEEQSQAILLMGWALVACFGGILKWRPHGWLTGRKGTGKSWVWEMIIETLVGDFAYKGSAKDSEAGVRWGLDQDARPALFAEMEPKSESAKLRIGGILELARNASDDSSGRVNISQAGGGTKTFHLRSMFLFNSKNIPDEDAAIKSRILQFELKSGVHMEKKIAASKRLLDGGLMDDPGRFRRRIFHALPRIIADIEYIRSHYRETFGDQRAVDQVAPLLAAAWAVQSSKSVADSGEWINNWIAELAVEGRRVEDDEDAFMRHLLGSVLRTDENKSRTVAELLLAAAKGDTEQLDGVTDSSALLERYGIGLKRASKSTPLMLCIATNSAKLAELFAKTPYASGYGAQVRRHPLAEVEQAKIGGTKGVHKILAGQRVRCQLLDWEEFRARYIDEEAPF